MNKNLLICPTCRTTAPISDFEPDNSNHGAWCPVCNTYIWFDETNNHQKNTLILEQKTSSAPAKEKKQTKTLKTLQQTKSPTYPIIQPQSGQYAPAAPSRNRSIKRCAQHTTTINSSLLSLNCESRRLSPPLSPRLSPLRYPGGKSKLVNYLFTQLQTDKCETFVEVFAGGCSFGLALLDAGIINHLIINDKDKNLITFWDEVLNNPKTLITNLQTIQPNKKDYLQAKKLLSENVAISSSELAWAYLLVNRLSYSGIQKGGCMGGKNGSNEALLARYNPSRLIEQIKRISKMKNKITVLNQDFAECIENYYWDDKTTLFIDPPYVEKGKKLYNHYFTEQDHACLSELITSLTLEFPNCADILITYDNHKLINDLYWKLEPTIINRKYSI